MRTYVGVGNGWRRQILLVKNICALSHYQGLKLDHRVYNGTSYAGILCKRKVPCILSSITMEGEINVIVLHVCRDTKIRLSICCGILELCELNGINLKVFFLNTTHLNPFFTYCSLNLDISHCSLAKEPGFLKNISMTTLRTGVTADSDGCVHKIPVSHIVMMQNEKETMIHHLVSHLLVLRV